MRLPTLREYFDLSPLAQLAQKFAKGEDMVRVRCPDCGGTGEVAKVRGACPTCNGNYAPWERETFCWVYRRYNEFRGSDAEVIRRCEHPYVQQAYPTLWAAFRAVAPEDWVVLDVESRPADMFVVTMSSPAGLTRTASLLRDDMQDAGRYAEVQRQLKKLFP
jgi:hypothetical protein